MAAPLVGVNLKLYFGYAEALSYCRRVAEIAAAEPAIAKEALELFVLPSAPVLVDAVRILAPAGVHVGAQNMHWAAGGAYTGEIDAAMIAAVGCDTIAIGHAERRTLFGETDEDVARKVATAVEHGLTPVVCVGETLRLPADGAASDCAGQLERALSHVASRDARVVIAYEPLWAIGADAPAGSSHINAVCTALRRHVQSSGFRRASIIYGGTAGPGLWSELRNAVDGLFLGRRAHDPENLASVLAEISSAVRVKEPA